jgi:hypothetical protein
MTVAAIALAAGIGVASAAGPMNLTQDQKQKIQENLASQPSEQMPSGFTPTVGEKVPQSVSLKQLPSDVTSEVSELKNEQFAKSQNNDIILVDPQSREIVAVIEGTSTTGGSPGTSGGASGTMPSSPK